MGRRISARRDSVEYAMRKLGEAHACAEKAEASAARWKAEVERREAMMLAPEERALLNEGILGARKSGYEAAREAAAKCCEVPMSEILLHAGEMSAQSRRDVRAVLKCVAGKIRGMEVRGE